MRYKVTVPPTHDVGSYSTTVSSRSQFCRESYRAEALADYNSCRAHDGLPPVRRMPAGTVYAPIVEYVLQGDYGHGWDDLTAHPTRREAIDEARVYRENERGTYRIVRRAVDA